MELWTCDFSAVLCLISTHVARTNQCSFEGTLDRPRITGRVHIENAFARAKDFPTGLSGITGDVVFDATRLYLEI